MKVTKIWVGESESGNAGCNNGNYDVPVKIFFDNGEVAETQTCGCGNGCSGSFPLSLCKVGLEFNSIEEFWYWSDGDEDFGPTNGPEIYAAAEMAERAREAEPVKIVV